MQNAHCYLQRLIYGAENQTSFFELIFHSEKSHGRSSLDFTSIHNFA